MFSYKDFMNEDAKGKLTRNGDNLVSKFVVIKGVSKLIVEELNKYDQEKFGSKNVYIKNSQLTWTASINPKNEIEIKFTDKTTDVEVDGKSHGDIEYDGTLIIDVIEGTVTPKITEKGGSTPAEEQK
jgi:hypothetical protein